MMHADADDVIQRMLSEDIPLKSTQSTTKSTSQPRTDSVVSCYTCTSTYMWHYLHTLILYRY